MNILENNLCIIPARGGSKRIPRKNLKYFLGKPIIAYSIDAALTSGLFSEVMVSTDDAEIADLAIKYGAKVPFFRSEESSNDFATTLDVIKEVTLLYSNNDMLFDNLCCVYATAPFASNIHLQKSYESFINQNYDSLFPVIPYSFPIQRALKVDKSLSSFFSPEFANSRSQDLEKSYHDAGQYYWIKTNIALTKDKIITSNTGAYIISELEGQDIDNEIDWKLAEMKYELLQNIK